MHVRKFQGDTIEDTLKQIKSELGPDAIILKTTTNRGLKGAFKRSRVEVTAAITEKTYLKKATLESAVGENNIDALADQPASYLSDLIDDYDKKREAPKKASGYGNLGLNKRVNDNTELDSFLSTPVPETKESKFISSVNEFIGDAGVSQENESDKTDLLISDDEKNEQPQTVSIDANELDKLKQELGQLKELVNEISLKDAEQKIDKTIEEKHYIRSIYTLLKSSGINESFLQENIKEFVSERGNDGEDQLIDHVILKIQNSLKIDTIDFQTAAPGANLIFGTSNSGQSLLVRKFASMERGAELVVFGEKQESFAQKISGVSTHYTTSVAEAVSITRKIVEKGHNAFIDINVDEIGVDEVVSLHDYCCNNFEIFRSFLTLNSIHTEAFNLRQIRKYREYVSSINFTHTDLCLDWGSIFNCMYLEDIPVSYLSDGLSAQGDIKKFSNETLLNNLIG